MSRSIRSYQREIAALYGMLDSLEFTQQTYNGYPTCPYCDRSPHAEGCALKAVLDRRWPQREQEGRQEFLQVTQRRGQQQ